ncbi:hypothetical protein M378DRAFT_164935 [Amanita muscaria Koide BX008]|uniref:Uncharacterized protein n=1 Tax=Amanita muscaria (strain Koide BX008) TaxID=946122 RepID=A0A0C2T8V2_AMAMK|nr:hypothetical protein M378DRAFT_164935 [Amanita muscaria Koide BX008]
MSLGYHPRHRSQLHFWKFNLVDIHHNHLAPPSSSSPPTLSETLAYPTTTNPALAHHPRSIRNDVRLW